MWKAVICIAIACLVAVQLVAAEDEGKRVEMTGTLQMDVLAIGGETTGATLKNKEGVFELKLNDELRRKAESLNGKKVVVEGRLVVQVGIEVKVRKIIKVASLEEKK
jgi:hypothetical protein